MNRKYQISDGVKELLRESKIEPYNSINRRRGTSIDYFEYLIPAVDQTLQRFEREIGLSSTSTWKGLRLHECQPETPLSKTAASHLTGNYFAHFAEDEDAAIISLENYGTWEMPDGSMHYHCYTMPHLAIIRPIHIDAKKHIIELKLRSLEEKTRESMNQLIKKSQDQIFEAGLHLCEHLNKTYISFADILHSLATTYFEIEAHKSDPSLMDAFDTVIELPPHKSVIDALKETGYPVDYKLSEGEEVEGRRSFVKKNMAYIDLEQLGIECLESARRHVMSMDTIRRVFASLSELDFDTYAESMNEFFESQKPAGILSPIAFMEEHVNMRRI